jgi:hypothetical protein
MKVGKGLRTTLIVTVITVIVWVVADRSVLRSSNPMTVDVVVRCDAGYRITLIEPADMTMTVTFTGPGRGIDRLVAVNATEQRVKWEYTLSAKEAARAAGEEAPYAIPARDGFARTTDELRVTLADSKPSQVTIRVEKLDHELVAVELSQDDREQLTPDFEITPPQVKAIGTAEELTRLTRGAAAVIDLESDALLAGKTDEQTVALRPGNRGLQITFEPKTVVVRNLRLTQSLVEKTIEFRIPIEIEALPRVTNTYRIVLDPPEITNLKVKAPLGVQLKPEDVRAVVSLKPNTMPTGETPVDRGVEITFPNHKQVTLVGSQPSTAVTVKPHPTATPE